MLNSIGGVGMPKVSEEVKTYLLQLVTEGVIPEGIATTVIENGLDAPFSSAGMSILQGMVRSEKIKPEKKQEIIKRLLGLGASPDLSYQFSGRYYTPLISAIELELHGVIAPIIKSMKTPLVPFMLGMNALHCAVALKNTEAVKMLMQDARFQEAIYQVDAMRRTPMDIAASLGDEEMLGVLLGRNVTPEDKQKYRFGEERVYIGQGACSRAVMQFKADPGINKKLKMYCKLKAKTESAEFIDEKGNCNGLAFLHQVFPDDVFYAMLNTISKWDGLPTGSEQSLDKLGLPDILKKDFKNVSDLIECVINWAVLFQAHKFSVFDQTDRVGQFSFVKSNIDKRDLLKSYSFPMRSVGLNKSQVVELVTIFQKMKNIGVGVGVRAHAFSLKKYNDDKFHYYDSNLYYRVPDVTQPEVVADMIFQSHGDSEGSVMIGFDINKWVMPSVQIDASDTNRVIFEGGVNHH